ncbi:MAG: M64 family metallopeptidase [Thermoguttaceae bacterium]
MKNLLYYLAVVCVAIKRWLPAGAADKPSGTVAGRAAKLKIAIKSCSLQPSQRQFLAPVFLSCLVCLICLARQAKAAFDTIVEHGPSSNRVNVFFLGDGYTATDIAAGTYNTHVQNYVNYMFANSVNSDPFYRYRNFFNLYKVNVVSNESGADEPQNGIYKDTALDATYRYDGVTDRLLYINSSKAYAALNTAIAGSGKTAQIKFVTVNDTIYGGGGGSFAVYAGGNSSSCEIALHENGHSFSNLADEYDYGGSGTTYTGPEPSQVNVTTDPSGSKWSQWLGYNDPTGSVVGAYEGASYYKYGIYRPTANSKMRSLGVPFNAICREKIIQDIYSIVHPLDSYTSNVATLMDPLELEVDRVDDSVISTLWFVDGTPYTAADDLSSLNISSLNLASGHHTVSVRAYDPTGFDLVNGWVRTQTDLLQQNVAWDVLVSVPEPSAFVLLAAGVFSLLALRSRFSHHMQIVQGDKSGRWRGRG